MGNTSFVHLLPESSTLEPFWVYLNCNAICPKTTSNTSVVKQVEFITH